MTKRPEIVGVTPAGDGHQVLTLSGSDGTFRHRRAPCEECPWRVDMTGSFPGEAFAHSACTAADMATHTFACPMSGAEKPATCAGFLLNNADNNLTVRLAAMKGRYEPRKVTDGGHELHASYRVMAVANGLSPDSPALAACRANGEL